MIRVRYTEIGETCSVVHKEYAANAASAALEFEKRLAGTYAKLNVNSYDVLVIPVASFQSAVVIAGE